MREASIIHHDASIVTHEIKNPIRDTMSQTGFEVLLRIVTPKKLDYLINFLSSSVEISSDFFIFIVLLLSST